MPPPRGAPWCLPSGQIFCASGPLRRAPLGAHAPSAPGGVPLAPAAASVPRHWPRRRPWCLVIGQSASPAEPPPDRNYGCCGHIPTLEGLGE
eukprot:scaffold3651_cov230-Prasinococcus_capsulatus_cf.AAC.1